MSKEKIGDFIWPKYKYESRKNSDTGSTYNTVTTFLEIEGYLVPIKRHSVNLGRRESAKSVKQFIEDIKSQYRLPNTEAGIKEWLDKKMLYRKEDKNKYL